MSRNIWVQSLHFIYTWRYNTTRKNAVMWRALMWVKKKPEKGCKIVLFWRRYLITRQIASVHRIIILIAMILLWNLSPGRLAPHASSALLTARSQKQQCIGFLVKAWKSSFGSNLIRRINIQSSAVQCTAVQLESGKIQKWPEGLRRYAPKKV